MATIEQKLGELLRLERERRKIPIEEISSEIKIPVSNLEGIENGDLSLLPSPVYYNLFARTYSQSLGIDYNRTLDAIKEEVSVESKSAEKSKIQLNANEISKPAPKPAQSLNLKTPSRKIIGSAVVIMLVFAGFLAVENLFFSDGNARSNSSELLKGVDAERLNALAGFNWETPGYKSPPEIKIDLKPRSESWGTVMADGDTVLFRRLVPGMVYSASAKYRLMVSIGVPQAVDIEINGRLVDLRDPSNQRISRVEVNQANLESFLNPSFDNLPAPDKDLKMQGSVEEDSPGKVLMSEKGVNTSDTLSATTN